MNRGTAAPLSPTSNPFRRRLWSGNANGLFLKTETSAYARKCQVTHLLRLSAPQTRFPKNKGGSEAKKKFVYVQSGPRFRPL